jgi:hypothetical protein
MVRKRQWFWDFVSAKNSAGAHNPVKALDTLASSKQFSDEAVQLAIRSTDCAIAESMDKPIHEPVPRPASTAQRFSPDRTSPSPADPAPGKTRAGYA